MLKVKCGLEQASLSSFSNDLFEDFSTWVVTDHLQKRVFIDAACDCVLELLDEIRETKKRLFLFGPSSYRFFLEYLQKKIFQPLIQCKLSASYEQFESVLYETQEISMQKVLNTREEEPLIMIFTGNSISQDLMAVAEQARLRNFSSITFSAGFSNHTLRTIGSYNFFFPSKDERYSEIAYLYFCYYLMDRFQRHFIPKNLEPIKNELLLH